jgi:hypothetical protein
VEESHKKLIKQNDENSIKDQTENILDNKIFLDLLNESLSVVEYRLLSDTHPHGLTQKWKFYKDLHYDLAGESFHNDKVGVLWSRSHTFKL